MKLVTFVENGQAQAGVWLERGIVSLAGSDFPADMKALIAAGPETARKALAWAQQPGRPAVDPAAARFLAPVQNPGKIMAIGLNYMDHCREQGVKPPERPMVFAKFNTSLNHPGGAIRWDRQLTHEVDLEVELGVVIGRPARNVSEADALDHVFGYTIINDVSARDLQFSDKQWVRGKSLDTFCPVGPYILTADEVADPQALKLASRINGQVMQNSSTAEMIFPVRHLVSFLSRAFTLEPGDLIATGTPDGVGVFRKPPVFLRGGDVVECEVEGLGVLRNPCVEE